jgi:ABC-type antimicrobial peptide transport system permease subunit
MALGASTHSIRKVVLAFGLTTAGLGVTSGIALVLAASRWISPLLFETSFTDITVMGLVATLLGSATLVACLLPARLAIQVDPVECLRSEA